MKAEEILCPEKQQLYKNIGFCMNMVADHVHDWTGDVQCLLKGK
jgi:hypothetical protein